MNKRDVNAAMLEAQQDVADRSLALTICELECLGYAVEALGHNSGLEIKFWWTNTRTFEFQNIGLVSNSEAEAWARAAEAWGYKHDRKGLLRATHSGELTPAQLEGHDSHGGAKLLSSASRLS